MEEKAIEEMHGITFDIYSLNKKQLSVDDDELTIIEEAEEEPMEDIDDYAEEIGFQINDPINDEAIKMAIETNHNVIPIPDPGIAFGNADNGG